MATPTHAYLVANARFHDTDYARLELLKFLAEDPDVRTRVAEDFRDLDALHASDFLVTYTCDLRPTPEQEQAIHDYIAGGKRWLALHGSNAILEFRDEGVYCPRTHDTYMHTVGSRFIAHPAIEPYRVTVSDPEHPLVRGIDAFETSDELYLCDYFGDITPLLETRFTGKFDAGYIENDWPDDEPRLVAYTHRVGRGEVLYLSLGHCCGVHDMKPLMDEAPVVRGSWESPIFHELLRRGLRWAKPAAN